MVLEHAHRATLGLARIADPLEGHLDERAELAASGQEHAHHRLAGRTRLAARTTVALRGHEELGAHASGPELRPLRVTSKRSNREKFGKPFPRTDDSEGATNSAIGIGMCPQPDDFQPIAAAAVRNIALLLEKRPGVTTYELAIPKDRFLEERNTGARARSLGQLVLLFVERRKHQLHHFGLSELAHRPRTLCASRGQVQDACRQWGYAAGLILEARSGLRFAAAR